MPYGFDTQRLGNDFDRLDSAMPNLSPSHRFSQPPIVRSGRREIHQNREKYHDQSEFELIRYKEMKQSYGTTYPPSSSSHRKVTRVSNERGNGYQRRNFNPHYGQDDARHDLPESSYNDTNPVGRANYGIRQSQREDEDNGPYVREGPSPGRKFHHGIESFSLHKKESFPIDDAIQRRVDNNSSPFVTITPHQTSVRDTRDFLPPQIEGTQATRSPLKQSSLATTVSPHRTDGTRGKRKTFDKQDEVSPQLISHQSSDDSMKFTSGKKKRSSSPPNISLMNSYTPLSPLYSRTFSRDEHYDSQSFVGTKDPNACQIFQSWSSGNSFSDKHSENHGSHDRWQLGGFDVGRSRSWEENRMTRSNGKHTQLQSFSRPPPIPNFSFQDDSPGESGGNMTPDNLRYDSRSRFVNNGEEQRKSYQLNNNHGNSYHANDFYQSDQGQIVRSHQGNNSNLASGGRSYQPHLQSYFEGNGRYPASKDFNSPSRGHGGLNQQGSQNLPPTYGMNNYQVNVFENSNYPPTLQNMMQSNNWNHPRGGHFHPMLLSRDHRQVRVGYGYNRNNYGRMSSVRIETEPNGICRMRTSNGILLLSLPEDRMSLSETLSIVRENIEVFVASDMDVDAPAPGRKRPVVKGQVGLRCIHCRSSTQQSERVKRAVCFPSSTKRIYRTVIDMKLDHFGSCPFVPMHLKVKLEELKATNARSTGTTMQYFVEAASRIGMEDGKDGIFFLKGKNILNDETEQDVKSQTNYEEKKSSICTQKMKKNNNIFRKSILSDQSVSTIVPSCSSRSYSIELSISNDTIDTATRVILQDKKSEQEGPSPTKFYAGKISLALPEDVTALSPLRCFLRENVYAFSATKEDIAVRTPTTFSVVEGQVGIGCIHCYSLPAKERSNRAVCFPFSIARIYQSVADIQRFHLASCKRVPEKIRNKFLELQSQSSKGSKGLATRQYWITSARRIGLWDSKTGIKFRRDPSIPIEKKTDSYVDKNGKGICRNEISLRPLVLPDDKPHIAEFLFEVMKQLQPCQFTEADKNKRRLKHVGSTGVECKHCAGQVDGRKFFWSSVNAVESNFVSVHTHMMECRMIPEDYKKELARLKGLRKEHTSKLKSGSQKAFFSRVWARLHNVQDIVAPLPTPTTSNVRGQSQELFSLNPFSCEAIRKHSSDRLLQSSSRHEVSFIHEKDTKGMNKLSQPLKEEQLCDNNNIDKRERNNSISSIDESNIRCLPCKNSNLQQRVLSEKTLPEQPKVLKMKDDDTEHILSKSSECMSEKSNSEELVDVSTLPSSPDSLNNTTNHNQSSPTLSSQRHEKSELINKNNNTKEDVEINCSEMHPRPVDKLPSDDKDDSMEETK